MPAVFHPLPHVAVHVVQTKRNWAKAVHRHRGLAVFTLGAAVVAGAFAVVVGLGSANAVPPPKCGLRAATGGVLSLCFAQQPVGLATDWDLAAQPAPDYEVDQRINW